MRMPNRSEARETSNNKANPNKNGCVLAVAKTLGVENLVKYLHCVEDLNRAAKKKWITKSCVSGIRGKLVQDCAKQFRLKTGNNPMVVAYIVVVDKHVMIVDENGKTLTDTHPSHTSTHPIKKVYKVSRYRSYRQGGRVFQMINGKKVYKN